MVEKIDGKMRESGHKRWEGDAEMEATVSDIGHVLRMVDAEKLSSRKDKLKKMKKTLYSLMVSLELTQRKLKRVSGKLQEKVVLTQSLWDAAEARKRDRIGQERGLEEMPKRRQQEKCAQKFFYGSEPGVYDRDLGYAQMTTSQFCFE